MIVARDEVHVVDAHPVAGGRRHHRRRRPLRRRASSTASRTATTSAPRAGSARCAAAEVICHLGAAPGGVARASWRRPLLGALTRVKLPRYRTGDAELDADDRRARRRRSPTRRTPTSSSSSSCRRCASPRDRADRGDLKIANAALKEMRYAFHVFAPYRSARKVAIFGSARTQPDDPLYEQTRELAARARGARLDGHHRRRPRDHGGRASRARAPRTRSA